MNDRRKIEESIIETEKILSEKRNQERNINKKRVINNQGGGAGTKIREHMRFST